MSYKNVLAKAIQESKMTLKELSDKCTELGLSISDSYISQLKTGKLTNPSDEISRVLAIALDINENALILESYLDKAPKQIVEFIDNIRLSLQARECLKNNELDNNRVLELSDELKNIPLSNFILNFNSKNLFNKVIAMAEIDANIFNSIDIDDYLNLKEMKEKSSVEDILDMVKSQTLYEHLLTINDDSMFPVFPNGTKFVIQDENYSQGDLVGFIELSTFNQYARRFYKKDNICIFVPINNNYNPIILHETQVSIIGKVNYAIIIM